jgi:hypothetical protein
MGLEGAGVIATRSALPFRTVAGLGQGEKPEASGDRPRERSLRASLPRDIEVEARADAALIKEADGRAIPINALKLSRTTRVIMPGATYCAE